MRRNICLKYLPLHLHNSIVAQRTKPSARFKQLFSQSALTSSCSMFSTLLTRQKGTWTGVLWLPLIILDRLLEGGRWVGFTAEPSKWWTWKLGFHCQWVGLALNEILSQSGRPLRCGFFTYNLQIWVTGDLLHLSCLVEEEKIMLYSNTCLYKFCFYNSNYKMIFFYWFKLVKGWKV